MCLFAEKRTPDEEIRFCSDVRVNICAENDLLTIFAVPVENQRRRGRG